MKVAAYVEITSLYGAMTVPMTAEHLALFKRDMRAGISAALGVEYEQYEGWLSHGGRVPCCAITRRGHPCQRHVAGVLYEEPKDWAKAPPGYCPSHGG